MSLEKVSLIKLEEFLRSIQRKYPIESLGGFSYWIRKQGAPSKWPLTMWERKLQEYLGRKI